jgi:hypothetical protein
MRNQKRGGEGLIGTLCFFDGVTCCLWKRDALSENAHVAHIF